MGNTNSFRMAFLRYLIKMYAIAFKLVFERALYDGYAPGLADDPSIGVATVTNRDPHSRWGIMHRYREYVGRIFEHFHHGCYWGRRAYGDSPGYSWTFKHRCERLDRS